MEYLYWQRGGGGKDGTDPVYYFTLESSRSTTPPSSGDGEFLTTQIPQNIFIQNESPSEDTEGVASSAEKPKQARKFQDDAEMEVEAGVVVARQLEAKANSEAPSSFKNVSNTTMSLSQGILPRHRVSTRGTTAAKNNTRSLDGLTPPDAGCTLVQRYTITAGFDTVRLTLKLGFIKPLIEETLGIAYTKNLSLNVRFIIEGCSEKIDAVLGTKQGYLTRWSRIRSLLGGFLFGDELVFTYMGKRNTGHNAVYYFTLKKVSISMSDAEEEDEEMMEKDDMEAEGGLLMLLNAATAEPDESMDNLMKDLEEWNNKYDDGESSPPLVDVTRPVEEKEMQKMSPCPAPLPLQEAKNDTGLPAPVIDPEPESSLLLDFIPIPAAPLPGADAPVAPPSSPVEAAALATENEEPGSNRLAVSLLQSANLLNQGIPEQKMEISRAPNAPTMFQQLLQGPPSQLPSLPQLVNFEIRKLPDPRLELNSPSVFATCANEINALESQMRSVAAAAELATDNSAGFPNEKAIQRYSRARYFVDIGTAKRSYVFRSGDAGVFYDQQDDLFSHHVFKENSNWGGSYIASFKTPLVEELKAHGANMSYSLENVLRGQWPYKVWMGDMKNTALLPAGVGVVALEDIPAGSFVAQFIGEYISWEELPKPTPEIFIAYCEQAKLAPSQNEEEQGEERKEHELVPNNKNENSGLADEKDTTAVGERPKNVLWVGNLLPYCNECALKDLFSKFGKVVLFTLVRGWKNSYAVITFANLSAAVNAMNGLQGTEIPSLSGRKSLLMRYKSHAKAGSKTATDGGGHANNISDYDDFYYRNMHSQAAKRYRVLFAEGTECLVPTDAAKTILATQKILVENSSLPNSLRYKDQWRSLETTIIDSSFTGNATHFMRRSEVHFNLARVQLNVPNGPTKILYYAKRDIVKGEELVREI